jgi:D-inositol-3-phosphate glycosyltransferase
LNNSDVLAQPPQNLPPTHYLCHVLKKLKIFVIGPGWPLRGGLATFDELLCRAFQEAGHDCEIISFSLQYPGFLFPGTSQFDHDRKPPKGVKIRSLINSINPFNWIILGNKLKKERPDFVVIRFWLPFMGPSLGTIARRLRSNGHTRVISLLDNAIPHEKRFGDRMFANYFLKSCHGFLAMSHSVINDLKKFAVPQNAVFAEHPLYSSFGDAIDKQAAREHLKLPTGGKYLLFFGLIRKYKGLDLLLEAMADERLKNDNIQLIVAGEYYEDPSYYNEIIARNKLEDRVHLHTKFIPDDEVKYYFSACDLVTQTYHTATQSGVTKIALHFDKPSLVTNVGGLGEIIEHGKSGYVVPAEKASVSDSIVDYYTNNREASFVAATQIEKKKYSWEVIVAKFETLYEGLKKS